MRLLIKILAAASILFCDLMASAHAARICTRPQFAKELEYRAILFGAKKVTPQEAIQAGNEYDEILARYCRDVKSLPKALNSEHVGDNCYQMRGIYQGKAVYWGECYE